MGILTYPNDLARDQNDYIKFEHYQYQVNSGKPIGGRGSALSERSINENINGPKEGNSIILYMPNSTPASHYSHEANYQTFPGPLGQLGKTALQCFGY